MSSYNYDPSRPHMPDVSHWHPIVDESAFVNAHPPAVGFKDIQDGSGDPTAARHLGIAERHGIPAIGYMYDTNRVDDYLRAFPPKAGRIPCIDFEGSSSVQMAVADAVKLHAEHGMWPVFYGRRMWIDKGQPTGTAIENCPFWGAEYGPTLFVPNGVGRPILHQYYGGVVGPSPHSYPGVAGLCDMNSLLVPATWFREYSGLTPTKPAPPKWPGRFLQFQKDRMHGSDVLTYKHRLQHLHFPVSDSDVFGPRADDATRRLQARHKLAVDGIVGPITWRAAWT